MLRLDLFGGDWPVKRILCLGAHCDDIEIGCGGTLLRLLEDAPSEGAGTHPDRQGGETRGLEIAWVVFSSDETRARETRAGAELFLRGARSRTITVHDFRDGFLPEHWSRVKEAFEKAKREFMPDLVFTHYRHDLHQDHRIVSELTWNTFRDQLILEYEIPKWDGDMGNPNFFVQLDEGLARRKAAGLLECYGSQAAKPWFGEDTFLSLMRLRGMEANSLGKFAEGFYCRKLRI